MSERLEAGAIVDGRYRIASRLGSGGMADVYCAEDLQLGRKVALKLLYARFAEDEEFVERFRREASAAAGLQHQHVVSVYDRGTWDGTSYIAMEFVDGRTLKELVQERGPLPAAEAIDLTVQVLRAARFAHKRGVIHRDLKPHNVIVDESSGPIRAKVTDFGIARAGASDMTETGSIMGTAQYLSPEQAQGHAVSAQSDLYSVGILLYELIVGRVPFDGDSAVAIALKQVSEPPVPPGRLVPDVPPALEAVVLRALEKTPARRFADADEFIAALEAAARGLPPAAGETGATAVALGAYAAGTTQVFAAPPADTTGTFVQPSVPFAAVPPPVVAEKQDGNGRWWVAAIVALLVVAGIVGLLLLTSTRQVEVPRVLGAPEAEATVTLRNRGFDTEVVMKRSDKERGSVIGQTPSGGTEVDEGSLITLTVSAGPGEATIPELRDKGRRAARRTLTGLGFEVRETERTDPEIRRDRVIETLPDAGSRIERGETVELIVSSGPKVAEVPDVLRKPRDEAQRLLEDAGFEVRFMAREDAQADPGTVLAQDPAGKTDAPEGATVTLTVAEEPKEVEVPDVTGQTQAEAIATLSGAGFKVQRDEVPVTDVDQDGVVIRQSPRDGQSVDRGATVTIGVGKFDDSGLDPDPQPTDPGAGTTGAAGPGAATTTPAPGA